MVTMTTILIWIIMFFGGMLSGYAIASRQVPTWVRVCGLAVVAFDLGLLALSIAEVATGHII
jgi:hypothetical protein